MTIQAKVDTILKAKQLPSGMLKAHEKINVRKGDALQVAKVLPAPNQHLEVHLINSPIKIGFIYEPHWNYATDRVVLDMSYYFQIDNPSGYGWRECCGTSNAMMLNKVLKGKLDRDAAARGIKQPESIYLDILAEEGDTTDHSANTRALKRFGIDSYWSTNLGYEDYYLSIRNGIPVVLGLDYKGPDQGHIVCGAGFLFPYKVIVHDPNGAREGWTDSWISNLPEAGKYDEYEIDTFTRIWLPGADEDSRVGWGRIVQAVDGVKTVFG